MARIAYFDCFSGISGDMILGGLFACGGDPNAFHKTLSRLDLGDWTLNVEPVTRSGIGALRAIVTAQPEEVHGRHLHHIVDMIVAAGLPDKVTHSSVAVFRKLAEAEARIHQTDVESLHFHEVGAVDAIVDIVGACVLLEQLGIDRICASPLPMGHGFVDCMHGVIPLPAPAVVEILKGIPTYGVDVEAELVTPTGAALLATLASDFGSQPRMRIAASGYGAGSRELPHRPNLLRVLIGESDDHVGEEVAIVETNIDDLSPQFYDAVMDRLFAAGALDVYTEPIHMKKNRPAVLLTVLCAPEAVDVISSLLFAETTTLGVRIGRMERRCMEREFTSVTTPFGEVRIKVARWTGGIAKAMPEYDDIRRAADATAVPVARVWEAAMAEYWRKKEEN